MAPTTRVKNKNAAPIQTTFEFILSDARHLQKQDDALLRRPKQKFVDLIELDAHRREKRRHFEHLISRQGRDNPSAWVRYARWEESQKDFRRARSIWERAVDAHRRDYTLYLKFAEFEMKHRFLNHARNVWDRAVTLFPRVDQLWYKFIHMEEMVGNVAGARQIFERWLLWEPPEQRGWFSYIDFELRYKEIERARMIFERLLGCHPKNVCAWIRYAKFEMKNGEIARARNCYERAIDKVMVDEDDDAKAAEDLLMAFATFEELCNQTERAKCIYRFALRRMDAQID